MKRLIGVGLACAAVALGGVAAPVASAAPTSSTEVPQCRYEVRLDSTGVHENPDTNSIIRKWKHAGDIVAGDCVVRYDDEGATYFHSVYCECASDGYGWIAEFRLRLL